MLGVALSTKSGSARWPRTEPSLSGDAISNLYIAWSVKLLAMGTALIA
jgi:hypothetical protein